jgi:Spy/CpxP family protein refolding chaperone
MRYQDLQAHAAGLIDVSGVFAHTWMIRAKPWDWQRVIWERRNTTGSLTHDGDTMKAFAALTLMASLSLPTLALAQDAEPETGGQSQPEAGGEDTPDAKPEEGETRERGDGDRESRRERRGRRGFGFDAEQLKERLGLNDEQVAQLKEIQESMAGLRDEMRELFRSGDMQAARERMQGLRAEIEGKMKDVLTPEQWEKMQEGGMGRMFGRGRGGDRGGFGRGGREGRERGRARLREEAVKALNLGEEEAAVVLPLLDTVLETRELLMKEGEQRRNDFLKKAREESDPEALAAALEAFRAAKAEDKAQIAAAQEQLREVLTLEQEARLVALNILD